MGALRLPLLQRSLSATIRRLILAMGQREGERAALPLAAGQPDSAAQDADELADEREPQPGPAVVARERVGHLIEAIEDARLLSLRDTDSAVLDLDDHPRILRRRRPRQHDHAADVLQRARASH